MAKSRIMTGFNGWVAFYNLTPESVLEDLGANEGVKVVPEQSYSSEARVSSRLDNETGISQRLDFQSCRFENDNRVTSLRARWQSFDVILNLFQDLAVRKRCQEQEILRPSAEILSANSTTNAQNDKVSSLAPCGRGLGRGVEQEQEIFRPSAEILSTNPMTNAQNDMVVGINITSGVIPCLTRNRKNKQISTILRFFGLCPQNDKVSSLAPCGRGLGRGVEKENEILRPSTEVLSANSTTNAQNDKNRRHCGLDPQSQSRTQEKDHTLTPTPSPNWRGEMKPAFTLAEGATHVDMFHDIRKSAFTLAEVLVTLGIIGVVAAMTLPMLAKNYQFYIRQQQFKKAYAAINIAAQKTQIDMGEGVRCSYVASNYSENDHVDCELFFHELSKNLQVQKVCKGNSLKNHCIPTDLRGGEKVYAETQGGNDKQAAENLYTEQCRGFNTEHLQKFVTTYQVRAGFYFIPFFTTVRNRFTAVFIVDVNGNKGPNKWGHDVFMFEFARANQYESVSKLIPTTRCQPLDSGGYYTTHFFEYLYGQNAEL